MIALFVVSILICLFLVTGLRLRKTLRADPLSRDSQPDVERSPDFYAPMERLLAETDFTYLRTRPEIPKATIEKMRKERRRIFRKYLSCLAADFARITTEIRTIMVHSSVSRPDLAATLLRARMIFAFAMLALDARLFLHACGIHTVTISASQLTRGLAQMQRELKQLSPTPVYSL